MSQYQQYLKNNLAKINNEFLQNTEKVLLQYREIPIIIISVTEGFQYHDVHSNGLSRDQIIQEMEIILKMLKSGNQIRGIKA